MTLASRRWVLVWALALLPLLGWWLYGLFDVDEGFYGAVVAEMNRRGEWVTPFYNGKPWFEKPILLYWLAKPCLMVFGDVIGPRIPSIVCTFASYGVIAWFANRKLNAAVAQLAVLIMASSLLVVGTGRLMMTDLPLLLCFTAAMLTFWESLVDKPSWRVATAGLLGLGALAKGPVAMILFALIAGWTYWREREMRPAFRGYWPSGIALMLIVVAAWYLPAYRVNGQVFVQKFLIEQNIGRFVGGDAAHTLGGVASALIYVPIFLLGMAPWSVFVWSAWPRRNPVKSGVTTSAPNTEPLRRYLASWAAIVFLFFTASGAKLPHYILPMCPPIALLVADYAVNRTGHSKRWFYSAAGWCVVVAFIANGAFLWWFNASGQAEVQGIARYVKKEGGDVAMYQMGRRQKDMGTGKLKLQETSLPSLLMYLDKDVLDTDSFTEIESAHKPIWIITREDRIRLADFIGAQKAGYRLEEVKPPVRQQHFKLYRLE